MDEKKFQSLMNQAEAMRRLPGINIITDMPC